MIMRKSLRCDNVCLSDKVKWNDNEAQLVIALLINKFCVRTTCS